MTDQSTGLKTWRAPSCTHHTCRFVHVLEDYLLLMVEGGCPLYRKRTVYIYVLLEKSFVSHMCSGILVVVHLKREIYIYMQMCGCPPVYIYTYIYIHLHLALAKDLGGCPPWLSIRCYKAYIECVFIVVYIYIVRSKKSRWLLLILTSACCMSDRIA